MDQRNKRMHQVVRTMLILSILFNAIVLGGKAEATTAFYQSINRSHIAITTPKGIAPPSSVRISRCEATKVTVTWTKVKGAQMYTILLNDKSIGEFTEIGTTAKTTIEITGLFPGTQYYVKVVSTKDGKSSRPSTYTSFRTLRN